MFYARLDDNVVIATTIRKPSNMDGWVAVNGTLPPRPIAEDDTEPRLILKDGALVWLVGKSRAEVEAERARAYRDRVDPITSEISRLRDMGGTEDEIAEAMERREAEVARIKAEMPYPEEG